MPGHDKIEVQAYAGYRGEECPRSFLFAGRKIVVVRIMEQWTEETEDSKRRYRCFKVKGGDWRVHILCFDERNMEWYHRKS